MESNWKTERDTILEQSNDSFTTFSAEGCVLCHLSISPEGTSYCMHFDTAENGVIMETTKDGIVKVSVISKGVEVERIDVSMIAHKQIVDMNVDGVRWEGDVFKDSPCGKGTITSYTRVSSSTDSTSVTARRSTLRRKRSSIKEGSATTRGMERALCLTAMAKWCMKESGRTTVTTRSRATWS